MDPKYSLIKGLHCNYDALSNYLIEVDSLRTHLNAMK